MTGASGTWSWGPGIGTPRPLDPKTFVPAVGGELTHVPEALIVGDVSDLRHLDKLVDVINVAAKHEALLRHRDVRSGRF